MDRDKILFYSEFGNNRNKKRIFVLIKRLININIYLFFAVIPSTFFPRLFKAPLASKTVAFLILLQLVAFLIFIYNLKNTRISLLVQASVLNTLVFLLFLYLLISYFVSSRDLHSLMFLETLGLLFLYVLLINLTSTNLHKIFYAIALGAFIQIAYANLQFAGILITNHTLYPITGSFFNPGPFACYLASTIPAAFLLYKENSQSEVTNENRITTTKTSFVFLFISIINILSIIFFVIFVGSRAALIGIVASVLIWVFFCPGNIARARGYLYRISRRKLLALFIASITTILIATYFLYSIKRNSVNGRFLIWRISSDIFLDNYLWGCGFDAFKSVYMDYQANFFSRNPESKHLLFSANTSYAFNDLLQFTIENGLVGLSLICLIFGSVLAIVLNNFSRKLVIASVAMMVGILIPSFFGYSSQILPIKISFIFCLAILSKYSKVFTIKHIHMLVNSSTLKALLFIMVVYINILMLKFTRTLYEHFSDWKAAVDIYNFDYRSASALFADQQDYFKKNGEFLMNYGKSLVFEKKYLKAIEILREARKLENSSLVELALGDSYFALKKFHLAEYAYRRGSNMIPHLFYPKYKLFLTYFHNKQHEKCLDYGTKILNEKVKVQSTYSDQMHKQVKQIMAVLEVQCHEKNN